MGASDPKLEPVTAEEDFQVLEPARESAGGQIQDIQLEHQGIMSEPQVVSERPSDGAGAAHNSTSGKCECEQCAMLETLLRQYQTHNNQRPPVFESVRRDERISITIPSPTVLLGRAKSAASNFSIRIIESLSKQKQRIAETSQRLRDRLPVVRVPPRVVKGLVCLVVLTVVVFAGIGVYSVCCPSRPAHHSMHHASQRLSELVQSLQQQNDWLNHQLNEKSAHIDTLTFQLVKAREHAEILTSRLREATQQQWSAEQLVKLGGLSTEELNETIDMTVGHCAMPDFTFRFLGEEYSGHYQGQCVGRTPHGQGRILTPEGREFRGGFRGGRMHGTILVVVGDRADQYQFVHGVENGFYHTQGYHNTQVVGCRLHGQKIGAQLHIDTTGRLIYSVLGEQLSEHAPMVTVSDDAKTVLMQGAPSLQSGGQVTFVLPPSNIQQPQESHGEKPKCTSIPKRPQHTHKERKRPSRRNLFGNLKRNSMDFLDGWGVFDL